MRISIQLAWGLCAFGLLVLALTALLASELPGPINEPGSVAGFLNLASWGTGKLVRGLGLLFGAGPLFVGTLGLISYYLANRAVNDASSEVQHLSLEEPWEYLPQEARGNPKNVPRRATVPESPSAPEPEKL